MTLLELLLVCAILAALVALLAPALSSARAQGTKAKCMANLRSILQAFEAYSGDDPSGHTSPVHPFAETRWLYDGEYEYGGKTGLDIFAAINNSAPDQDLRAENRPLNRYLFGTNMNVPWDMFECPSDVGIPSAPFNFDAVFQKKSTIGRRSHEVTGTSYRLNNHIDFTRRTRYYEFFYGPYMRPRSRVPDPASVVLLEETLAEVAKWNARDYRTMGWHRKPNVFVVGFADSHADSIHLAGQDDPSAAYPDYWILRGDGWRMDCYPEAPILDRPSRRQ